ncbi:LETM1-related biofilm-associated protein [Subsaxibacter sp. CAU 1640]|uniref:LETM1-related biofilm-associated protein n=1 Tax=Subsaxibacter sp. CAU 1640 TaxID=2933271 RepID=UPI0020033A0E|nr:LETM1-related biofilm-associated protein [Subsaxibacter sp. CAU 1640]MCK7591643.1 LETM1-related biofilm-associated protein [Subsaxibacter sp. CAU 1640]
MNPSADGWIKKLLKDVSKNETFLQLPINTFYHHLKLSGYIYGNNVAVVHEVFDKNDWTDEELCKVNHILALLYIHNSQSSEKNFVESVIQFYNAIEEYKESFIQGLLGKKQSSMLLEGIINKRIHIDDNLLTKNFSYFITNALLFIDILAYQKYLSSSSISDTYLKDMELTIETIALTLFELKTNKTKYDESLIKLFESSLRYQYAENTTYNDVIKYIQNPLEKYYALDIACMASWTDKEIDHKELEFLNQLGNDLELKEEVILHAINDINIFYISNKDQIPLLTKKNLAQSFYDNSSKMVIKLINRNSKRLLKELRESKELMYLLTKSTTKTLSPEEQKKVNEQLLDIIKSIPSLAIFMLPGGAILLPLFVKFIPKLLPSSFDENRIED